MQGHVQTALLFSDRGQLDDDGNLQVPKSMKDELSGRKRPECEEVTVLETRGAFLQTRTHPYTVLRFHVYAARPCQPHAASAIETSQPPFLPELCPPSVHRLTSYDGTLPLGGAVCHPLPAANTCKVHRLLM